MAETALSFLLDSVSKLLIHYVDLISNAKDEIQSLENDLKLLKALLQMAATKSKKVELYRELERQIRQLVYDVEDTIDDCLILKTQPRPWRCLRHLNPKRVSMAEKVRDLNNCKVKPMVNMISVFAIMDSTGGPTETSDTQLAFFAARTTSTSQDKIVGLEDEEEKIMNFLSEQTGELDVVSIIGMPGLGKTTLASKIYHNEDIQSNFSVCIWVYVSKSFNMKEVLRTILIKLKKGDGSNLQEGELVEKVRKHLDEVKFFLVLDDIWTIEAWKSIQAVLPPMNNFNSKVLITSRFTNVCQVANPFRIPHRMRFLHPDESWKLLQLQVFGKVDVCPKELVTIGIRIANECDGLPLAIMVIGGYLLSLKSPQNTTNVLKDKWDEVPKNLYDYILRENDQNILKIVSWSYNVLPTEMRECFIYLAVFPENKEIETWTLMHLWIAEGFIQQKPTDKRSLEDIAKENLNSLIAMNLVMVGRTNPKGEYKTIRVLEHIRAFCNSKASVTDQNLFQEIKKTDRDFNPKVHNINNHRRICIHSNIEDFLLQRPKGPKVRSFLCFDNRSTELGSNLTTSIPKAFKLLRVLDSKSIRFKKYPTRLTKMVYLRYITVSVDDLDLLPADVSALWNLQILVIETKKNSLTIQANIWKMIQLRHLKTKASIILTPHKEAGEANDNLQTLGRLSPESCSKELFEKSRNLRRLGIQGNLVTFFNKKCIDGLAYIEKLKLVNDILQSNDTLSRLPEPGWFPTNLKRLTITATSLGWEQISTLTAMKNLGILKLKEKAFVGIEWKLHNDCFRSLHFLLIENTDLITWEASSNNFPELKALVLNNMEALKEIPIVFAEKLEILEMENMGEYAVDSALKIEEYSRKMKSAWEGQFRLSIGDGCKRKTRH